MSLTWQSRVKFVELDATKPDWPVNDGDYEIVLMSYISGSVPAEIISALYKNAYKALKPVRHATRIDSRPSSARRPSEARLSARAAHSVPPETRPRVCAH